MGQKVNPIGFRVGTFLPWQSKWFATNKEYKDYLLEDIKIRESCDEGHPIVLSRPDSQPSKSYKEIAQKIVKKLGPPFMF